MKEIDEEQYGIHVPETEEASIENTDNNVSVTSIEADLPTLLRSVTENFASVVDTQLYIPIFRILSIDTMLELCGAL